MIGPVHHVGGGVKQPVVHEEACRLALPCILDFVGVRVVADIQVHRVANNQWGRVGGIVGLQHRKVHFLTLVQLPVVEVKELWPLASVEREVQVVDTRYDARQEGFENSPFFPTACAADFDRAQAQSVQTVGM